jgi:hypothetical protein
MNAPKTQYSFAQVQKFLKLSKSGASDNGPYTLRFDMSWYDIYDRDNIVVGQVPLNEWNRHISRQ